jgi:hypothetical protein
MIVAGVGAPTSCRHAPGGAPAHEATIAERDYEGLMGTELVGSMFNIAIFHGKFSPTIRPHCS